MKKLLLVFALISLFSCGNNEEVKPKETNIATISVRSQCNYAIAVMYMTKDKWGSEEPYLFEKRMTRDTTIQVHIDKHQNFGYFIQRQGENPNLPLEATLAYNGYNKSKNFVSSGGILWDIYEFYPQPY
jgi:hypothetical protein